MTSPPTDPVSKQKTKASLGHRALRGVLVGAGASMARLAIQLLLQAILARLIAPEHFGTIALAIIVTSFAERVLPLGINLALTQKQAITEDQYRTAATVLVAVSFVVAAGYYSLSPLLASFFGSPEFVDIVDTLCILFPIKILTKIHISSLQRELRFTTLAASQLLSYLLGYGVISLVFATQDAGVWALVFALIAQSLALYAMVAVPSSLQLRPRFKLQEAVGLSKLGGGFLLITVGNFLALQIDNIVVGRYFSPSVLGFYSRAYQITTLPATLFDTAVQQVLFPSLSKIQHDTLRLQSAFLRGSALLATASFVGSGLLFLLAPDLIRIMLGPSWTDAEPLLQILSVSLGPRTLYKIADTVSSSSGAVYRLALQHWIYAGLVAVGAIVGSNWGINGIACGVSAAIFGGYLMAHKLCLDILNLSFLDLARIQGPALLLSVVLMVPAAAVTYFCHQYSLPSIVTVLLTTSITCCGMVGFYRVGFGYSTHFRAGLRSIISAVRGTK